MSEKVRLLRDQLEGFIENDPNAVRTMERLFDNVNTLIDEVSALTIQVEDLETRVTALETP